MTIELSARQERVIQDAIRQGRFQSVEQAVDAALTTLTSAEPPVYRFTPGEAVTRIRSLRQGNILPAGTTIRTMIEDGRA
jgi:pectin methylesterase-like acyl-CoA thioesterase